MDSHTNLTQSFEEAEGRDVKIKKNKLQVFPKKDLMKKICLEDWIFLSIFLASSEHARVLANKKPACRSR